MSASRFAPASQVPAIFEDEAARALFGQLFTRGKNADFKLGARILRSAQSLAGDARIGVAHVEAAYQSVPACMLGCRTNCGLCD